ncbi:hypothetical protein [Psychrobacillus phage Spoks]|nr:hypothetical protein [Psychrobacillus phage Spoks]
MKKLPAIELKEYEIDEVDGEFVHNVTNTERHPLFFNNKSMLVGKQYGILEKGLEQELFSMLGVVDKKAIKSFTNGDEVDSEQVIKITELLSIDHMKDIIWLAFVGAKNGECYDLEEFKEKYDEDFQTTLGVYMEVLMSNFKENNQPNAFKTGLAKSVASLGGKK